MIMFQSTHPRRVRLNQADSSVRAAMFQSTHPRRVRLHIQQMSEYHSTKLPILRKLSKQNN